MTPIAVATNTPGSPIFIGVNPTGVVVTPDGKTAYVTNQSSDTVTPIAVATNTPGRPISVGHNPFGIAVTSDGKVVYVTNIGSDTVRRLLWRPTLLAVRSPLSQSARDRDNAGAASDATQLSVDPPSPAAAGTTETLTATVTPSAAGSVQFTDGTTTIGNPATVTNGTASITTTLPVGTHPLTAVFTPTEPAAFESSTSPVVTFMVNPPTGATGTTTTLKVFPNRTFQGVPVSLLATAAPRGAAGTVQFMEWTTALGAPVPVIGGFALTIVTLPTGTHSLTAVFTPSN